MRIVSLLAVASLASLVVACGHPASPAASPSSGGSVAPSAGTEGALAPPEVAVAMPLTTQVAASDVPAAQPVKRTLLIVGKLLDVKTGRVLTDQAIAIDGDKIAGIVPKAQAKREGATVIELPTATVLPGLIDSHTHLTFDPKVHGYDALGISLARETLTGAANARTTLLAGFTTVRNLGASGWCDVALKQAIDEGEIDGPRIDASGPALGITGGHCDDTLLPPGFHYDVGDAIADGVEHVQHKVREVIKYGATVIKVCATGGVMSRGDDPQASQYSLEEMKALVADAHRLGRRVAAHAHGAQGIRFASEAGVDSIEHGSYLDDAGIALMKSKGTYLVPTLLTQEWLMAHLDEKDVEPWVKAKATAVHEAAFKNFARAVARGVKVALGTDAGVFPHGLNARELGIEVKLGMTPLQALQTATINAADLLGWSNKVGSLEAGKYADVIAVDGDPLKDVTTLEKVKFVMKGGVVYKNDYR